MRARCQTLRDRTVGNPAFGNCVPDPPAADSTEGHGDCKEHRLRDRHKKTLGTLLISGRKRVGNHKR